MLVTEEQAGKQTCPRKIGNGGGSCAGPACMAWRWLDDHVPDPVRNRRGYCGLAGIPVAGDEDKLINE